MNLKKLRERACLTQKELGSLVGVGNQFVSNIERGLCYWPPEHVLLVAKALKISPEELIKEATIFFKRNYREKVYDQNQNKELWA